jgi:Fe(3+) dicitrate transport protein
MTATYTISGAFNIRAGVNNLGDVAYFTRRAGGYPGPGILPADGRGFFLSFGAKF